MKHPEEPIDEGSPEARNRLRFARESLKRKKLHGILRGGLLIAVAKSSLGYDSPAVSTVLSHGPVVRSENIFASTKAIHTRRLCLIQNLAMKDSYEWFPTSRAESSEGHITMP